MQSFTVNIMAFELDGNTAEKGYPGDDKCTTTASNFLDYSV
jgi:hypothetical protein